MFPTSAFYIDGQLVDDETVRTIKAALASGLGPAMAEPVATQAPAAPVEPEMVQDYNDCSPG